MSTHILKCTEHIFYKHYKPSAKQLAESAQASTSNGIKIAGDLINRLCRKFGGELAVALRFVFWIIVENSAWTQTNGVAQLQSDSKLPVYSKAWVIKSLASIKRALTSYIT